MQTDLFGPPPGPVLPAGLIYEAGFLTPDEEAGLLQWIAALPLREARYKAYTARRRVVNYGTQYDFDDNRLLPAAEVPPELLPLRERIGAWTGLPAAQFRSALVAEYRPGTPLGWHRDVPDHEVVVGVSLGGEARMRLRPYPVGQPSRGVPRANLAERQDPPPTGEPTAPAADAHTAPHGPAPSLDQPAFGQPGGLTVVTLPTVVTLTLAPRSIYVLRGPARWAWQHCIMPTPALRHSITFRTASNRGRGERRADSESAAARFSAF